MKGNYGPTQRVEGRRDDRYLSVLDLKDVEVSLTTLFKEEPLSYGTLIRVSTLSSRLGILERA